MLVLLRELIFHTKDAVVQIVGIFGVWAYVVLFLVIFCETGLVVTPFLPGDSLLFAAGAVAATGAMDVRVLFGMLVVAAIVGDNCNYWIGRTMGPRILRNENSRVLKKAYLDRTRHFFDRYGGKAVILGRFTPIVRTFMPFLAGVGAMHYRKFLALDIVGGVAWIGIFTFAGYYFGGLEWVEKRFSLVILAVIGISLLPGLVEYVRHRLAARPASDEA